MREILFRGKRKSDGEWIYGDLSTLGSGDPTIYPECSGYVRGGASVLPETVGQFTGLTDKNGKKIFEGDMLDCGDRIVRVHWHETRGTWDCEFVRYKGKQSSNGITPDEWKYRAVVICAVHDLDEFLGT